MSSDGKNKTAVVTGSSRGLGQACVEDLLSKGYRVVATARNPTAIKAKISAKNISTDKLLCRALDIRKEEDLRNFASWFQSEVGECHILVNNAGVYLDKAESAPLETPGHDLVETLMTNLYGPYRMMQILLPYMQKQKFGRIVNVSSGMGQLKEMGKGFPAYRISKTALNSLSSLAGQEFAGSNILINSVCPGWVRTDMGGPTATRDIAQGVASIMWAAYLGSDGPNGGYFRDGKNLDW